MGRFNVVKASICEIGPLSNNLTSFTGINSKWARNLSAIPEIVNLLEENIREKFWASIWPMILCVWI